ncbi:PEGA domain-containing protein [Persicimonas caeni]|uniref:PEGA domain-containing protein n=1 Tax=Persicimonas caeni TaxID=2292766 RepID=A0A4Y6PXU1_PERCE|nr:PEGA domain-containing protein [Persicimonas caeni]QDG53148.1 PEGA domain-containing protein [Persicimonas caeni]QED34370.1 PEGA domain-containing protein [Persicimonas caeni]
MLRRFNVAHLSVVFAVSLASLAVSSEAHAEQMAGLKFETGQIEDDLAKGLRTQVTKAFGEVDRWSFIGFDAARGKMAPITRDCFTKDCLTKAGNATGAPAGVSVEISGEAEIYDWTIETWDLRNGAKLKTEKGACELCGHTEVKRNFLASMKAALIGTGLPEGARAEAETEPPQPTEPEADRALPSPGDVPLQISAVPADTKIYVNDQMAGEGQVTRAVGPGTHKVRFQREGYGGLIETIVVNEQTEGPVIVRVHLSRTDPEAVEVPTGVGAIDRLGTQRTTYGLLAAGTGAALLGTGIYLVAIDGDTACDDGVPDAECPEVYATGGAGMTMGVLGTALLTGGATLLAWETLAGGSEEPQDEETVPAGDEEPARTMSLSPSVGADGAGLLLRGTF